MMIKWNLVEILKDIKVVLWIVGALWCWYMVNSNNNYFKIRSGDEKNLISCNIIMWFILMIICVVKCAQIFA